MFKHLQRYTRPQHFADFATFDRNEYYVCFGQHRDSDTVTRSNHRVALASLGGASDTVFVVRDSHCLVGWVEAIYIHHTNTAACAIADRLLGKQESYPVLSEDDWSELQWTEAAEFWASLPVRDRVRICTNHGITPFAARRDELPKDPQGGLVDYLSDGV